MKKFLVSVVALPLVLSIASCTWVKVSEEGQDVVILPADRVGHCTRLGEVNASVKDKILGLSRKDKKVQAELDNLAKNQAVSLKANTLVRASEEDGSANYIAYRCPVSN